MSLKLSLKLKHAAGLLVAGGLVLSAFNVTAVAEERHGDHRGWKDHYDRGERGDNYDREDRYDRGDRYDRDDRDDWGRYGRYYSAPPVIYGRPAYYPPPVVYGPPIVYAPSVGIVLPGLTFGIR